MTTRKGGPKAPPRVTPNKFLIALKHKNMDVFKCEWFVGEAQQQPLSCSEWSGRGRRRCKECRTDWLSPLGKAVPPLVLGELLLLPPPLQRFLFVHPRVVGAQNHRTEKEGPPVEAFWDHQTGPYLSACLTPLWPPRASMLPRCCSQSTRKRRRIRTTYQRRRGSWNSRRR